MLEVKLEASEQEKNELKHKVQQLETNVDIIVRAINQTNQPLIGDGKTVQIGSSLWTLSLWSMVSMFISFVWNLAIGALVFVAIGASVRAMVMTPEEKKKRAKAA